MACTPLRADVFADTIPEFNTAEATNVMNDVVDSVANIDDDFDAVLEKVRKVNPEYAFQIQQIADTDATKYEAVNMLRVWLMDSVYDRYKNMFMDELKSRSQETGRQIKNREFVSQDNIFNEYIHWLDRGNIDTAKCRKDGWQICYWPNGFEDYEVSIRENLVSSAISGIKDDYKTVGFVKDLKDSNERIDCEISVGKRYAEKGYYLGENCGLDVMCQTYKYEEYHKWRNNLVADVIAGGYDVVSVEQQLDGSPFGKTVEILRINENPEFWESTKLPSVRMSGRDYSYSTSVSGKGQSIDKNTLHALWTIEFEALEREMKDLAPDIVVSVADKNDVVRQRVYKNWLAEQAAKDAVNQVVQEMYRASRETGRVIKKRNANDDIVATDSIDISGGLYWLDRGDLDSAKCLIGKTGYYKCPYPKNYQEKQLVLDVDESYVNIILDEDVIEDGQWRHIVTEIVYECDAENVIDSNECWFAAYKYVYKDYQDYYRMLSEENEVALNNQALQKLSKRKLRKIRQECSRSTSVKPDVCKDDSDVEMARGLSIEGAVYTVEGF